MSRIFEEKIPTNSNAYLFEDKRYKARESKLLQYILKLQKSEIMFESIVKSKIINQQDKKIFKMNAGKVAKKFNILIGNERIPAADLIQSMIKPQEDNKINFNTFVLGSSDMYYDFFRDSKKHREPLAINYLQASCFYNLIRELETVYEKI